MPEYYENIPGYFDFQSVYSSIYSALSPGNIFIEIGVFAGKSLCCMGELEKEFKKGIKIIGVDHFQGSPEEYQHKEFIKSLDKPLVEFCWDHLKNAGVNDLVTIINGDYIDIARSNLFDRQSVSAIFFDANHSVGETYQAIANWFPKIKVGGIISGHDYLWDSVKTDVDDFFGKGNVESRANNSWWIIKTHEDINEQIKELENV